MPPSLVKAIIEYSKLNLPKKDLSVPDSTGSQKIMARVKRLLKRVSSAVWAFIQYGNLKDWLPRTWGRKFLIQVATLSLVAGIVAAFILYALSRNLPTPSELERFEQRLITRVYDANGVTLKEFYTQQRVPVTLNQIPRHLKEALLATEDRDFYDHWGVNLRRLAAAMVGNIRSMRIISGGVWWAIPARSSSAPMRCTRSHGGLLMASPK